MNPRPPNTRDPRVWPLALLVTLAPFLVQGLTLALTDSVRVTALAAVLLALAFIVTAVRIVRRRPEAGAPMPSIAGLVLAIVTYHALAFPVVYVLWARFD